MTFKIEIKNKKKVEDVLNNLSREDLSPLAEFIIRMIRVRTRLGFGVDNNGGSRKKLSTLAESTITSRNKKKNNGNLSLETGPRKSNLTMTGAMLESIDYAIEKLRIILTISNTKRNDSESTNREIASYMELGDPKKNRPPRKFFNISDSEIKQVKREAIKIIKKKLSNT